MGQVERNKRGTWLQALWCLSDLVAIGGGFLLGYWARFHSPLAEWIPPAKGIPPLSLYCLGAAVTAAIWLPLFHVFGLYRLDRGRTRQRWRDLARGLGYGMLLVAALSFFYRGASFSRLAVPLIWFFTSILTVLGRFLVHRLVGRWSRLQPVRFAVVGRNRGARQIVRALRGSPYPHEFVGTFSTEADTTSGTNGIVRPWTRAQPLIPEPAFATVGGRGRGDAWTAGPNELHPTGFATELSTELSAGPMVVSNPDEDLDEGPDLGPVSEIRLIAASHRLDLIVMAAPAAEGNQVEEVYAQCQEMDLDFQFLPDLLSLWGRRVRVEEIDGLPVLRLRDLSLVGWNGVAKRTMDLVVSGALLVVTAPVLLALAIAVKLDSRGPVFLRQERTGRDRRPFPMLKFRSMHAEAERESGPVWATDEDPRRTRVGTFLRKWSLDELPQLWNVFKGQMSLVGPRPERPFFVHQFEGRVQNYYDRHRVKSGMTGWAQVHGLRGNVPIEERTRYDLYYVEHWSLFLDFRILWRTMRAVVSHRGN